MNLKETLLSAMKSQVGQLMPIPLPEFPELNGQVFARVLSAKEASEIHSIENSDVCAEAHFAVRVACDKDGNRIFANKDAGQLQYGAQPIMERIVAIGREANGLTYENRKGLVKNSGPTAESGSPTT
jgi:hypothetical protein